MKTTGSVFLAIVLVAGCSSSPVGPSVVANLSPIPASGSARVTVERVEDIRVVDGYIDVAERLTGMLRGTSNFSSDALVLYKSGIVPTAVCAFNPGQCRPGSTLSLHALWTVPDIAGNVSLRNQTYQLGIGPRQCNEMGIELMASVVLPGEAAAATLTVPFTLAGSIDCGSGRQRLNGAGSASVYLRWSAPLAAWQLDAIRYNVR